jgi:hypothetical protein
VIDGDGRCPPADVYLLLPPDKTGSFIIDAIKREMPLINLMNWSFDPDWSPHRPVEPANDNYLGAVVAYMRLAEPGRYSLNAICKDLELTTRQQANVKTYLRDPKRPLLRNLKAIGVAYGVEGSGRGARSHLDKAA